LVNSQESIEFKEIYHLFEEIRRRKREVYARGVDKKNIALILLALASGEC
jgi:hypothetical protein